MTALFDDIVDRIYQEQDAQDRVEDAAEDERLEQPVKHAA